jgi:LuxR family maltose regulon positive regulatory protein
LSLALGAGAIGQANMDSFAGERASGQDNARRAITVDGVALLLTKLAPPPARPDCVKRRRLFERLDASIAGRLTLVSTPAGFGKTTLLSSWYAARADRADGPDSEPALAWLSLEGADDDPARFWVYVLRALQQAHERTPDHPLLALAVSPLASTETFLTALLNAFGAPTSSPARATPAETVLILDDYHAIADPAIHNAMTFLLEHLPPRLHLVIASRTTPPLPLVKLRAGGQLAELGADDLCFSAEEIARFLGSALPISFTTEQIAGLCARTAGWIMPLRLAALAWRGGQDVGAFIASLRADHHALVEYLAAEVFGRQSEETQRFLLATSMLEACSGPLCDAVLQRTNSQRILEHLARQGLFLVPLDAAHRWYRFHALFAGFLQDRLRQVPPDVLAVWHSRAADWYLQGESAEADGPSRALPHLVAARDWERAAGLIEAAAERMLWQSGEVATLLRWLEQLPPEIVGARPRLALASAWALTLTGQFDDAEAALQGVERCLSASDTRAVDPGAGLHYRQLSGGALAFRARIAAFHDAERASALSDQALQRLPPEKDLLQADLLLNVGYAHLRRSDFVAAGRAFQEARRIGRRCGNVRAVMLASRYLASSYAARGLLNDAAPVYRQALRSATAGGQEPPPAAGTVYVGSALLLYERNELDAAHDQAERGLALGRRSGELKTLFPGYLALARIHQGLGDPARAHQVLDDAERLADLRLASWTDAELVAARARLHLEQGEIGLAVRALARDGWQIQQLEGEQPIPFSVCPLGIQLAWARVLLARRRPVEAAALLRCALDGVRRAQPQASTLPIVALHALALAAGGADGHALALLADVLPGAIAQGYIRTFVDEGAPMAALLRQPMLSGGAPEVGDVLAAFPPADVEEPRTNRADVQPTSPLSAREAEVMRLMAAGLSNQQIAEELVVALSTVRSHTKHIYRKLGVQGRIRAVARATTLHVL